MATVQCGGPPTRATHVTMPARLLRGDVLQCGAASAGARGRRGVCGEPAHLPLGPSRFSWAPTCCFCAFSLADSGFLPSRSVQGPGSGPSREAQAATSRPRTRLALAATTEAQMLTGGTRRPRLRGLVTALRVSRWCKGEQERNASVTFLKRLLSAAPGRRPAQRTPRCPRSRTRCFRRASSW